MAIYTISTRKSAPEERFWSKVKFAPGDACWEWQAFCYPTGHGQFNLNSKDIKASRALWIMYNGPLHSDQYVCHRCNNPKCVRLDHLYLGTHRTNIDDMIRAKRRRWERCAVHKLCWEDVRKIRGLLGKRRHQDIASRFGVNVTTISRIARNLYWKVEDDPLHGNLHSFD